MKILFKFIIFVAVIILIIVISSYFLVKDVDGVSTKSISYGKNVTRQLLDNPLETMLPIKTVVVEAKDDVILTKSYLFGVLKYAETEVIRDQGATITWRKWLGDHAKIQTVDFSEETEGKAKEVNGTIMRDEAISTYLESQKNFAWKTEENSKNFCVFENLGDEGDLFPLSLWVRCGEFVMKDGELEETSGISAPAKVDYPNELSFYDVERFSYIMPRDGSLYGKDVKNIFPEEVQEKIFGHSAEKVSKYLEEVARKRWEK